MQPSLTRASAILLTLAAAVTPTAAYANHNGDNTIYDEGTTFLLSRSTNGGVPNGPSANAAISWDQRRNTLAAFESDASDLVQSDPNGLTDVFLVRRGEPIADDGAPWRIGATELVSVGLGQQPANGRSYKPALDGDSKHLSPHCVAFVSDASNLVRGDTNGVADVFVKDLRNGRIQRVSVDSRGRQANGPSFDISIDGGCTRVAFTSTATNLALRRTKVKAHRSLVTRAPQPGTSQVYVRILRGDPKDGGLVGQTFLASASNGRPGNGNSAQPSWARTGKALVFASQASNLHPSDSTATSDIYLRAFARSFRKFRVIECTRKRGRRTCRRTLRGATTLTLATRLVSVGSSGTGNGASVSPTVTDDALYVAYQTDASDLAPGDSNGVTDIVRARMNTSPPTQVLVSKTESAVANGPSFDPAITASGVAIFFSSDASNLKVFPYFGDDPNGVRDVMVGLPSILSSGVDSLDSQHHYVSGPSENPAPSTRHNYVLFESIDPRIDTAIPNPNGQRNIYLRYDGPFGQEGRPEP